MPAPATEGLTTTQRLMPWIAVLLAFVISLIGYAYTQGQVVSSLEQRLDRNCRILATIQGNTRFTIIQHSAEDENKDGVSPEAEAFREIFERSLTESC